MPKTKILFKMFYLYHKAAYDPVINLFSLDNNYDVAVSLTNESTRKFGIFSKKESTDVLINTMPGNVRVSDEKEKFDIVIVPDVVDEKKYDNAMLCMLYHGVTHTKTVTYRELEKHKDSKYIIFAESDYAVQQLQKSGSLHNSEVYKIGYPKLDPLFNSNHIDKKKLLQSLGLDTRKKTILYAPTYKPTSVYDLIGSIFEATKDHNLIVKLHHYAWLGRYANHSQHTLFEHEIKEFKDAVLLPKDEYSIVPYLEFADVLISEASGAITEFLATAKHGIIYDLEEKNLHHSDGQKLLVDDRKDFLKDSFIHISNPAELKSAIARALNPTDKMQVAVVNDRDKYFYKLDGEASLRAKLMIEKLYAEGNHRNIIN